MDVWTVRFGCRILRVTHPGASQTENIRSMRPFPQPVAYHGVCSIAGTFHQLPGNDSAACRVEMLRNGGEVLAISITGDKHNNDDDSIKRDTLFRASILKHEWIVFALN